VGQKDIIHTSSTSTLPPPVLPAASPAPAGASALPFVAGLGNYYGEIRAQIELDKKREKKMKKERKFMKKKDAFELETARLKAEAARLKYLHQRGKIIAQVEATLPLPPASFLPAKGSLPRL